nr:collagen alpha-1(III) chain-like [Anser cygnoides]
MRPEEEEEEEAGGHQGVCGGTGQGTFPCPRGKARPPRRSVPGAGAVPGALCPVPVPVLSPVPPRAALPPAPPGGRFVGSPVPPRQAAEPRGREGGAGGRGAAPGGAPGAVGAVGARGARRWGRTPGRPRVRARREHGVIHPGGFCLRDNDTFMIQLYFSSLIHFLFSLILGFCGCPPTPGVQPGLALFRYLLLAPSSQAK